MVVEKKVLVISSDPALHGFLRDNLGGESYRLAGTSNCNGQLKGTLEEELPEIIVLDVMMPMMNGIEVSLRLRQMCQTPILMLTTWGAGRDEVRRLDLAAEDYLSEPFGAVALVAQIEEALGRNGALVEA